MKFSIIITNIVTSLLPGESHGKSKHIDYNKCLHSVKKKNNDYTFSVTFVQIKQTFDCSSE